ncbi:MAG TPA: VWA domain-containing protein [Pyrinomonadaceae bacterium]|nr:VWA domain-containing protein [Pyrinomonadaceae bacterium]
MISLSFLANKFLRNYLCTCIGLVLCLSGVGAARAQGQDDPVERVETNLVRLNVGVADRKGYAVTNLSPADFVVYEDGVRQNITSFEPSLAPFSLVLLLDVSGSTLNFRTTLRQTALRFIDALGPEDRVAVVSFNDKVKTLTDFTADRRKIAFAIAEMTDGRGNTDFYKALRHALSQLDKEGQRRKAIVVLTDGVDTNLRREDGAATAGASTNEEAIAAVKPAENNTVRAVLDAADRQGVTIYPLALPSGDPKKMLPLTPQQAAIYASARTRMQTLADRTGGRIHEINRLEDIGRLYAEVAADMRTLYSITYRPSGERPRDGKWRAINIEISRAELIARTRPGYFAR